MSEPGVQLVVAAKCDYCGSKFSQVVVTTLDQTLVNMAIGFGNCKTFDLHHVLSDVTFTIRR